MRFGLFQIALHSCKLGFQDRGRGDPRKPACLFSKADGLLGLPHGSRPVADFRFRPPLREKHPREIAEPSLRAQLGTGLGEKAYADVEGANNIGGASKYSRSSRIPMPCFGKPLELGVQVASPPQWFDIGRYRDQTRVRLRQLQPIGRSENSRAKFVACAAPPAALRGAPKQIAGQIARAGGMGLSREPDQGGNLRGIVGRWRPADLSTPGDTNQRELIRFVRLGLTQEALH